MVTRKIIAGAVTGLLALGFIAGTSATSAQTNNRGHGAAVKGTIQGLTSSSFGLKTTSAVVSVTYTAQTRVEKVTTGTTADLASKAHVALTVQAGTTTVTAITIEPAFTKPAGSPTSTTHPVHPRPTPGATRTAGKKPGRGTKPTTKPTRTAGAATHAEGQVAGLSGTTLTLSVRGGASVKYTLAANVKITKIVAATTDALANGETVGVFASSTGAAREITILAS